MYDFLERISLLQSAIFVVCSSFFCYALVKAAASSTKPVIYPPGPPQDPLIGNLRNFPVDKWWETFCEWQKLYGSYLRTPI